ncbi:MAG: glucosaminidase domain-containing protein [Bacteroidaceae bacterium]|nr:glucosaminidase domain-containing protein [Bacteroidaceae bacterium]
MKSMKKIIVTLFFSFVYVFSVFAQQRNQLYLDYIEKYHQEAIEQMQRYHIPASITLAQGLLESGAGRSTLTRKSNNHFGIKCGSDWRGHKTYHDDDAKGECFRVYKNARESFEDHSRFLAGKNRYASLFTLKVTDYKGWAHGLKNAGYATNPAYATKLIQIIELYDLDRFDNGKLKGTWIANPHEPYLANGLLYVIARTGDTFETLSDEFGISARKLRKYNDLYKGYVPQQGDIIYLEKKNRRAHKGYKLHVVKSGDSMYTISQRYGIRLERLYKMNGKSLDYTPTLGEILRLR